MIHVEDETNGEGLSMNRMREMSTRRTILTLLKTKGGLTVNDLSGLLGITEMAVRRHLSGLEGEGYVEVRLMRQPMGRPTHVYSLTEEAEVFFPKNYHRYALDLLAELEQEDEALLDRIFERRKERLVQSYAPRMKGKPLGARVEQLAEIQDAGGYMVEWERQDSGDYVIHEYNCPISQIAIRYGQACRCELSLFESLLGTKVERIECLAQGGRKCTYRICAGSAHLEPVPAE
jgi:predicted ArsR family transcriptional regulator